MAAIVDFHQIHETFKDTKSGIHRDDADADVDFWMITVLWLQPRMHTCGDANEGAAKTVLYPIHVRTFPVVLCVSETLHT